MTWMIYGAYGYTGRLTAEEAVKRGHRPLLAGRREEKLAPLADKLDLDYVTVGLDDPTALREAVGRVELVLHDAGPFVHTARPMQAACLATGAHYLDITGEIPVYEETFSRHADAEAAGIALISGVGYDVVPSDCLIAYTAAKLAKPTHLELAFAALSRPSAGTTKTSFEMMGSGALVRENGDYRPIRLGSRTSTVRFPTIGERQVMVIPWGDVATAYRTTGIPNIQASMAMPPAMINAARLFGGLTGSILKIGPVRRLAERWVEQNVDGPDETMRESVRSYLWARVSNRRGESAEAWLETVEAYRLTAEASVRAVEQVLDSTLAGAFSPAQALGADFVMGIPGTVRYDELP